MTYKQRVMLEMWYSDDGTVHFTDDPKFFLSCPNTTPNFVFIGKEVDYWVFSPDDDFARETALKICESHHKGKYVTHKFDLSVLNPPQKEKKHAKERR